METKGDEYSCSTGGIIVTTIAYEYGCLGSSPSLDNFFFSLSYSVTGAGSI